MSSRRTALALSAVSLSILLALTGCTPEPAGPTPTSEPTPSSAPEPAPTETIEPVEPTSSTPVTTPCDTLVSLQAMYDFNPNFSLLGPWTPAAGTAAAEAAAADGALCRWQNGTSGETIDLSIASFDAATLDRLANETYDSSTMVPTYGGEGYFAMVNGAGEAVVFDRGYWVVMRSAWFMEPGDAEPLMSTVLSALP